jgi:hypothetical protein
VATATSLILKPTTDAVTAIQLSDKDGNAIVTVDTTNDRMGIGTTAPGAKLDVNGTTRLAQIITSTKTDNYVVTTSDFGSSLRMNSSSDKTFTLPSVGTSEDGARITFIKVGSGKMTLDAADSDYIYDSAAGATIYTTSSYATITIEYCDTDTRWYIISAVGTWTTT